MKTGEHRTVKGEEILSFIEGLLRSHRLLAPVCRDGVTGFDWIETPQDVRFVKGGIPTISAKKALLPRTEVLFYFNKSRGKESVVPAPPPSPQIIFGLHPCDVRAVQVLDVVFGAPPQADGPYLARRAVTTLIGMGAPPATTPPRSFFENLGISSMDNQGCDLFLAPLPETRFILEIITEKGAKLAESLGMGVRAGREELDLLAEIRHKAAARVNNRFGDADLRTRIDKLFDSPLWDELGEKCIACGACAFLCPTCHCFDIQDETRGDKGRRIRLWDTCQFELFTVHASGHNPRPTQKQRVRQRVFHKFDYGAKNYRIPFCVGCGRCASGCPMRNDLQRLLEKIEAHETERPGRPGS